VITKSGAVGVFLKKIKGVLYRLFDLAWGMHKELLKDRRELWFDLNHGFLATFGDMTL
jgi:hypothetical protein